MFDLKELDRKIQAILGRDLVGDEKTLMGEVANYLDFADAVGLLRKIQNATMSSDFKCGVAQKKALEELERQLRGRISRKKGVKSDNQRQLDALRIL